MPTEEERLRTNARQKAWRDRNIEERRAKEAAYRFANKDKIAAQLAARIARDPEGFMAARRAHSAAYYARHKQRATESTEDWQRRHRQQIAERRLLRKYRLTLADYDALWVAQLGACAICGCPLRRDASTHVDHCHETRTVRGLLCSRCNQALGLMRESPTFLRTAAAYIERSIRRVVGAEEEIVNPHQSDDGGCLRAPPPGDRLDIKVVEQT
jgi:Recombination endonuclease VII